MLHRFGTYEEAAIFVSRKRSDGYYAQVLHENASALWGPLAMSGVAAWVSEEAAEEGEEVPMTDIKAPLFPSELSMVVGSCTIAVAVLTALPLLYFLLVGLALYTRETVIGLVGLAVMLLLMVISMILAGWVCSSWVHRIWDETHSQHGVAKAIFYVVGVLAILLETPLGGLLLAVVFYYTLY